MSMMYQLNFPNSKIYTLNSKIGTVVFRLNVRLVYRLWILKLLFFMKYSAKCLWCINITIDFLTKKNYKSKCKTLMRLCNLWLCEPAPRTLDRIFQSNHFEICPIVLSIQQHPDYGFMERFNPLFIWSLLFVENYVILIKFWNTKLFEQIKFFVQILEIICLYKFKFTFTFKTSSYKQLQFVLGYSFIIIKNNTTKGKINFNLTV